MKLIPTQDNPAPAGGFPAMLRAADGMPIRAARWHPEGECRGTVVICSGRAEFIEKYFETVADLLTRGLAVVAFDWRGQGLSGRELSHRSKGHIDDFSIYERDLDAIATQVLDPFCPKPWFALAHSMGGAILIAQSRAGRSPFARIVTTAPMIDLYRLRLPRLARALAEILDAAGLGGAFIPGGNSRASMSHAFDGNVLTSDPLRFQRFAHILTKAPELAIGDPTIGWINAAFRLMGDFADAEYPRRVLTPILVFSAGADRVVNSRAVEAFAHRLKAGSVIALPSARHEILMERDGVRSQFWAAFDAFIPGSSVSAQPLASNSMA
jgi:lysophospholipase